MTPDEWEFEQLRRQQKPTAHDYIEMGLALVVTFAFVMVGLVIVVNLL